MNTPDNFPEIDTRAASWDAWFREWNRTHEYAPATGDSFDAGYRMGWKKATIRAASPVEPSEQTQAAFNTWCRKMGITPDAYVKQWMEQAFRSGRASVAPAVQEPEFVLPEAKDLFAFINRTPLLLSLLYDINLLPEIIRSAKDWNYMVAVCCHFGKALDRAPAPSAAPAEGWKDGIERAAKLLDDKREAFDAEHGFIDPETGTMEYGSGSRGQAKLDYVSELAEPAEEIRALLPAAPGATPDKGMK
jgi:hypothetical protein